MAEETPPVNTTTPAEAAPAAENLSLIAEAAKAPAGAAKPAPDGTSKKDETNLTPEQKLELEKQKALDAAKTNAPEKYESFKLPEGFNADEKIMGDFMKTAKEYNLPQDKAQKFVDMASGLAQTIMSKQAEAQAAQITTWKQEITADKDFGGANLQKTLQMAHRGLEKYADPSLKQVISQTGWGSHPGLIKTFARIGQAMSEDTTVSGDGAAAKRSTRPASEIIYDGK